jgi:hypothetical protein
MIVAIGIVGASGIAFILRHERTRGLDGGRQTSPPEPPVEEDARASSV